MRQGLNGLWLALGLSLCTGHALPQSGPASTHSGLVLAQAGQAAQTPAKPSVSEPLPAGTAPCARPLYLTFDTGHMEVAPLVAEVLARHQVKVTFFAANEATKTDRSLVVNARLAWRDIALSGNTTLDLSLWARNLADRQQTFLRSAALSGVLGPYGIYNDPRTWGFDATFKF